MFNKILITVTIILNLINQTWATNNAQSSKLAVISIFHKDKVGDQNQLKGIIAALEQQYQLTVDNIQFTDNEIDKINAYLKNDQQLKLVLIAGESASIYQDISANLPVENTLSVLSSHQMIKDYDKIIGGIKIWALPMHVMAHAFNSSVDTDYKGTRLVAVVGVAHNVSAQTIKAEYNKYKSEFVKVKDKFLMVILGGDAPTEHGKMQYYTAAEASQLATTVGDYAKKHDMAVLIFNGPRTGQHIDGKKDMAAHNTAMDHVTKAFYETLQQHLNKTNIFLYDFKQGEPSLYKAGLGLALQRQMPVLMPGESTSMISEAVDVLPASSVLIVKNKAMNNMHEAHIDSVLQAKEAKLFDYKQTDLMNPDAPVQKTLHQTAAEKIADIIYSELKTKHNFK